VLKRVIERLHGKINGVVNCTGGAHTKVLHYIDGLRIVKDNLLPVPPLFQLIQKESKTDWREMYKVLNCGTRLEIYVDEQHASEIISIANSFGIDAQVIGRVGAAEKAEVLIQSEHGEFLYS
jgi:phosphoribosylformylglycinamidine cyclo-ligase